MREAAFEAAFVVLGVVLALGANEWRESRARRSEANAALSEIVQELRGNRATVQQSFTYHSSVLDTLRQHDERRGPPDIRVFSRGFVSPAQVNQTAWETAAQTGALSHIAYEDVLLLSRAYRQQQRYDEQAGSIGQIIYAELYRAGPNSIVRNYHNLAAIIGTFAYRERGLLALYDSTLTAVRAPD
jgi:hypothetical protein